MDEFHKIKDNNCEGYKINKNGEIWDSEKSKYAKTKILNGYEVAEINGKLKSINRLVAKTFIKNPNPKTKIYVHHKDDDKLNNCYNNLEWVTQKENLAYSKINISHPRKVQKLNETGDVIEEYDSVTIAGNKNGVTRYAISKACLGVNKTCKGFKWKYKDDDFNHSKIDLTKGKTIDGYDNYYVFSDGQVYSKARKSFLKPCKNANKHTYVTLCKNKKKQNKYVHRLVAELFLENPHNKKFVRHKTKNKSNNKVNNLKWF